MDADEQQRLREKVTSAICAALAEEAKKRVTRSFEEWSLAEINVAWTTARDFARLYGLRVPGLPEVIRGEALACGHADYGVKWSLFVTEAIFSKSLSR